MNKEKLITAGYILTSLGLFVLAIDMWICGGEPFCREGNSLSSKIANAAITVNVIDPDREDLTTDWSGPLDPNFTVNLTGGSVSLTIPSDGDGDGDGDGH